MPTRPSRCITSPPEMQRYGTGALSQKLLEQKIKAAHFDDPDHPAWNIKANLAFWITVMTIEGAVLSALGAVFCFDDMRNNLTPHTGADYWGTRAWVRYPYFIGACAFFLGSYLCYFNVINKHHGRSITAEDIAAGHLKFCGAPDDWDPGAVATVFNLAGSCIHLLSVSSMFAGELSRTAETIESMLGINASICFIIASILQGEYNYWRKCTFQFQVVIPRCNFFGSVLLLISYAGGYDDFAKSRGMEDSLVTMPFFAGSMFFLIAAWLDLVLWKMEIYGLSFAHELTVSRSDHTVDLSQQVMIAVYVLNITMAWFRLGYVLTQPSHVSERSGDVWEIAEKLMTYHVILFLCSAMHHMPDIHPFDYLVMAMQAVAVFGFIAELAMFIGIEKTYRIFN